MFSKSRDKPFAAWSASYSLVRLLAVPLAYVTFPPRNGACTRDKPFTVWSASCNLVRLLAAPLAYVTFPPRNGSYTGTSSARRCALDQCLSKKKNYRAISKQ